LFKNYYLGLFICELFTISLKIELIKKICKPSYSNKELKRFKKIIILILFLYNSHFNAQVCKAGDIFTTYYDEVPDTLVDYKWNTSAESFLVDINSDNQHDFRISAGANIALGGQTRVIDIRPLHPSALCAFGRTDSVYHFLYNYWMLTRVSKPFMAGDTVSKSGIIWSNNVLALSDVSSFSGTGKNVVDWVSSTDKYIGIKYQSLADTLYGWIRVKLPTADKCYVKDWSIEANCSVIPPLSLSSNSPTICLNASATLNSSGAITYTWSTGTIGATEIVTPSVTTTYTVSGTTSNGCILSSAITQSVDACIGIEELQSFESMKVYPNPCVSFLKVEFFDENANSPIEILNYLGQSVLKVPYSNSFDVSALAQGIYSLKLIGKDQKSYCSKFVKE
jgi:hypothetical protein